MAVPVRAQIKPIAQNETSDGGGGPDVAVTSRNPKVRTLHAPPEIWDLVHETRTEFDPRSAFVRRLTSVNPLLLAAIVLIIGGGAVFGFMKLRGWSRSATVASSVREVGSNTQASSSQVTLPNKTASPSNQQTTNTPASIDIADSSVEKQITVAAPAALPGKRVVTKPRRENPTPSIAAGSATAANTEKKDKAQAPMTPDPKSDNRKSADPTVAKKESDKALSPRLIAPAKAGPTPKAKVIQWP